MRDITIRIAGSEDAEALAAMIDALNRYYRDPERQAGETRLAVDGWFRDGTSDTRYALALAGDRPVGFAAFAVLHPGNELRGLLFMKDLFVVPEQRGQGIGERLMRFLAEFCLRLGIGRIDWWVENDQSQRFYERLGATALPQKRPMRLEGKALADLAEE